MKNKSAIKIGDLVEVVGPPPFYSGELGLVTGFELSKEPLVTVLIEGQLAGFHKKWLNLIQS